MAFLATLSQGIAMKLVRNCVSFTLKVTFIIKHQIRIFRRLKMTRYNENGSGRFYWWIVELMEQSVSTFHGNILYVKLKVIASSFIESLRLHSNEYYTSD